MLLVVALALGGCGGTDPAAREPAAPTALPGATATPGAPGGRPTTTGSATPAPVLPVDPDARVRAGAAGWLGLKWSRAQPGTFDYVADFPAGLTFAEVEWCDVEPRPGVLDWTRLDALVSDAVTLGHAPMLKLRTGQCWGTTPPRVPLPPGRVGDEAAGKQTSTPPRDLDAYLALVRRVVQRYAARGVHVWAIENETDVPGFWAASPAAYDRLVRRVAPVVRAADPRARVLDSGLSSTGYGVVLAARLLARDRDRAALAAYRLHYGRRIEGGASRWPAVERVGGRDGLAAVLRSEPARRARQTWRHALALVRDGVVDAYQLHFYEAPEALAQALRAVRGALPSGARVEAWEVGTAWPGPRWDARRQAGDLWRSTALLLGSGVRVVVQLPVAWTPDADAQVFRGLTRPDGRVLPAGRGWAVLARALAGARPGTVAPVRERRGLRGVRWLAGPAGSPRPWRAVVWSETGPSPAPRAWRLRAATGRRLPAGSDVGAAPVLVRSPGPIR